MPCLMGSHGVMLATAMAVSGTVVLLVLCRQRPSTAPPEGSLRPCISGSKKKKKQQQRQKKRVHFAEEVVELRAEDCNAGEEKVEGGPVEEAAPSPAELPRVRRGWSECGRQVRRGMPANWVALYSGILRDRHHRMACSY